MGAAFRMLFASITSLLTGINYFCSAFANLGKVTEATSTMYVDETEIQNSITRLALERQRDSAIAQGATPPSLPAPKASKATA